MGLREIPRNMSCSTGSYWTNVSELGFKSALYETVVELFIAQEDASQLTTRVVCDVASHAGWCLWHGSPSLSLE